MNVGMTVGVGAGSILMAVAMIGLMLYLGIAQIADRLGGGFEDLAASLTVSLAQRNVAVTVPVEVGRSGHTITVEAWGERQTIVTNQPVRPGRYNMQLVSCEAVGAA